MKAIKIIGVAVTAVTLAAGFVFIAKNQYGYNQAKVSA